jgi:predicted DNA-binding helix-hairpin-helix protein
VLIGIDPKLAWALRNRAILPADINKASREILLRVPGCSRGQSQG